jgi:asparagine synthase (glutamine-hydrolysing)
LSIIDLSDEAKQPMVSEDGKLILVFNGEIYNFAELRTTVIEKGYVFKSHTDSEVILHGYHAYGKAILNKLRGMFAFCIWDINAQTLFIARDFFGIKPLYYTRNTLDGTIIFASEIKAILEHPSFIKKFNNDALKPYLTFQYSVLEETFFKGVYKLKPGHFMWIKNGEMTMERYWQNRYEPNHDSIESNVHNIQEMMRESVNYHKISDVKVGAFLSGGVDSSYITALLKPDKTFTVGFDAYESMYNETQLAEELSDKLGIENHKRIITADECFESLPHIMYHMDEPQSNPSAIPLYFLSELASEHVTVVLSGEGADELFAGYAWYQNSKVFNAYHKIPFGLRASLGKLARALPSNRMTNFVIKAGKPIESRFIGQAKIMSEDDAVKLLNKAYQTGPSIESIVAPFYSEVADQDELTKMQYLDLNLWLPGDILLKADKMSMAHSLELRVPFLDKEVIRLASTLPQKHRVSGNVTKVALRKAAEAALPDAWANRENIGFPVPIRYWFREPAVYERIKTAFSTEIAKQFFDCDVLMTYLQQHYDKRANHARVIWTVYVFLTWYDVFFTESKSVKAIKEN